MTARIRMLLMAAVFALAAGSVSAGEVAVVEMKDYRFLPEVITVKAGTTVRWVNMETRTSHDVVFDDDGMESERLFPEEYWERRFDEPGTYRYHCSPHHDRDMVGVVEVVP
jgi:plastocyanin